jgi:mannosyltransferase OCH1-like enzyme
MSSTCSIPRLIMQTWKTKDVPDHWKESPESISKKMKEWKHVLMTDEDNRRFVEKYFPNFLPYYDSFKHPIQRVDAVRYMWLYINGGIYLDLDIAVTKNLEKLFTCNHDFYLVQSSNIYSTYTNAFMISKPRVDFWLEVIEEMKTPVPWWCVTKHLIVMNSTGPMMLTRVANRYKKENKQFGVIEAKVLSTCNVCNLDECNIDLRASYTKVLKGSSWCSWDSKIMIFFYCKWKIILLIIILLILAYYLYKYYKNK